MYFMIKEKPQIKLMSPVKKLNSELDSVERFFSEFP